MRILHLTLTRRWFDMVASGKKREEYRERKDFWRRRLQGRTFDAVQFRNGYGAHAPRVLVECRGITTGAGRPEWGAAPGEVVYIIALGSVLERSGVA